MIYFKTKKDFKKLPIGIILIIIMGLSPFIIGYIGGTITEFITNESCNESNCFWGVIPWFLFITIPLGILSFIFFIIIALIDFIRLKKNNSYT
tara:strand:- start:321 stop:599 length:279 start_codon:yes stop_codon:yes gene_type:complete